MTFDEWVCETGQKYVIHQQSGGQQRQGQFFYNNFDWDKRRGKDVGDVPGVLPLNIDQDPFYDDKKLGNFLQWAEVNGGIWD